MVTPASMPSATLRRRTRLGIGLDAGHGPLHSGAELVEAHSQLIGLYCVPT
jgi:hypothetical protein